MAKARAELDWEGQFKAAINPARAQQIRYRRGVETDNVHHVLGAVCDTAGEGGDGAGERAEVMCSCDSSMKARELMQYFGALKDSEILSDAKRMR